MKNLQIALHDGMVIDASLDDFDVQGYTQTINDSSIVMLTIGKTIISKNTVQYLHLSDENAPNVEVFLHDGNKLSVYADNFNEVDISNEFNNPKLSMVAVGNAIVNKNAVKLITPVEEG